MSAVASATMSGDHTAGRPAELLPRRGRWVPLAVFAVFVAIGLVRLNPNPPLAVAAAVVAIGAGVLLVDPPSPLLLGFAGRRQRRKTAARPGTGSAEQYAVKHAPGAPISLELCVDATSALRERAESLGGCCVAGAGGRGWLVRATLPLDAGVFRATK